MDVIIAFFVGAAVTAGLQFAFRKKVNAVEDAGVLTIKTNIDNLEANLRLRLSELQARVTGVEVNIKGHVTSELAKAQKAVEYIPLTTGTDVTSTGTNGPGK